MPVKTEPPHIGCHPVEAMAPERVLVHIEQLIALIGAGHQTPHVKAILCRHVAGQVADLAGYCFRKLDISPWGDDERAAIAADPPFESR